MVLINEEAHQNLRLVALYLILCGSRKIKQMPTQRIIDKKIKNSVRRPSLTRIPGGEGRREKNTKVDK